MNKFYSDQLLNLADAMLEVYNATDFNENVCCVSYYEKISGLINAIILESSGEIELVTAELIEDYSEEDGTEYVLTIDDFGIWVLPIDSFSSEIESKNVFIDEQIIKSNKNILEFIDEEAEIYAFIMENDELTEEKNRLLYELEEENNTEKIIEINDGDMHGFSFSKTQGSETANYSFFSPDIKIVENMRKELLKVLEND